MKQYCQFHPTSPAKWRCCQCNRHFDNACLASLDEKNQAGECPFCKIALIYLPGEASFSEGSSSLKQLSIKNLTTDNLILLFCSVAIPACVTVLTTPSMLTMLLAIISVLFINLHFGRKAAFLVYNFQLTGKRTRSSRVRFKQSSLSALSVVTSIQVTLITTLLTLLPLYIFYQLSWFAGIALILAAGPSLPYLIIFSLHSNDNEHNISIGKLINELKPHAPKLAMLSLCCYWFVIFAIDLSFKLSPPVIAMPITGALIMTSLSIVLNASSELFFLTLRKLSTHSFSKEPETAPKGPGTLYNQKEISNLDTNLDLALKTGEYAKAVLLLEEALKRNAQSNLRRHQLFLVLHEINDHDKLARYADLFLHWMLERNKIKEASQFLYRLRKQDPTFQLNDISLMNTLAKHFVRIKKFALALWLAEDAQHRFDPSEELAELLLSGARALITHYQDLAKAEEFLLYIYKFCGEFSYAEAAKALLIHLQNTQKRQQDLKE